MNEKTLKSMAKKRFPLHHDSLVIMEKRLFKRPLKTSLKWGLLAGFPLLGLLEALRYLFLAFIDWIPSQAPQLESVFHPFFFDRLLLGLKILFFFATLIAFFSGYLKGLADRKNLLFQKEKLILDLGIFQQVEKLNQSLSFGRLSLKGTSSYSQRQPLQEESEADF